MDFGQVLMIAGILGVITSIFTMVFPKAFSQFCSVEKAKKFSHWEFLISIILFIVGMNV